MRKRPRGMWAATFGSFECPVCGGEPVDHRRPSRLVRFSDWMRTGTAPRSIATCVNGHEWAESARSVAITRTHGPVWLRRPVEVVRAVRRNRTMVPVPLTYLMAIVAGIGLGVLLELTLGWPWWLVAAGLVVLTWLFFTTSGLWTRSTGLRDDLIMAIDPLRGEAETLARLTEAVAGGRLACFTVDGWEGARALSGWGAHDELDSIVLSHGRTYVDPTWVLVTTAAASAPRDLEATRVEAAGELLDHSDQPPADITFDELPAWLRDKERRLASVDPPAWSAISLVVGGRAIPAHAARLGGEWSVIASDGGVIIEVRGSGVDPDGIALRHVVDLDPFIEGLRRARR